MRRKSLAGEPTRRTALVGGLAATAFAALYATPPTAKGPPTIRVADDRPGRPISRLIYGSNEIGVMDGGPASAALDRIASVTARRLGGNLMTTYNWVNNAANAGKDFNHANGAFLLEALGAPKSSWSRPGAVIEAMHDASIAMGAASLVTVPIAGYVAADFAGPASVAETAPSKRFVPVRWTGRTKASDPIDPGVADMPQLLSRLIERYGGANSSTGVRAYALDNEPGLWFENHTRIAPRPTPIKSLIERSLTAARAVKSIDPAAQVFGPASWGATEMLTFQNAPDWSDYRHYGNFLAAYLDAFKQASDRDGRRLLDVLDVHWYPFSRQGDLFRTETPDLDAARLDAPRSLDEPGFREDSWVTKTLPVGGEGLSLPILPSLTRLAERWFPGTAIAVTEFNYGGAGRIASALALADALGRFGRGGVYFASHWGSLDGWLKEAYRLYRASDSAGGAFGDRSLLVDVNVDSVSAYAAAGDGPRMHLVVINKTTESVAVDVAFVSGENRHLIAAFGFDAARPAAVDVPETVSFVDGALRLELPPRAARRYAFV